MKKTDIKKLTVIAMLVAVEIILSRFLSISTPVVKIGFGFIPIAMIAMLYGPVYAGIGAASADFLGATLFPTAAFFPGFTITAFLIGVTYGMALYNRPKSWIRICAAVWIVTVGLQLGLDTLWLQMITGKSYIALLPIRVFKTLLTAPIQIICIRFAASERLHLMLGIKPVYRRTAD